jgi:hypothetical protein
MWLLVLPTGVESLARDRFGRTTCYILIAVSFLTVVWALPWFGDAPPMTTRPFTTSWAHELFKSWEWIDY